MMALASYLLLTFFFSVFIAVFVVFMARPDKGADLLDIREVDGISVMWQNGMPTFTWMMHTDHGQLDLAGIWKFSVDPDDNGREQEWFQSGFDDSTWYDHPVPGTWNIEKPEWLDYVGVGWYRKRFTVPESMAGNFNRLTLDGVAFKGQVFLNGSLVGEHSGGYTQWSLDITDTALSGAENTLAIRIDTRRDYSTLPPLTGPGFSLNWWPYGGIKRGIRISSGPHVTLCKLVANTDHKGKLQGSVVLYNRGENGAEVDVDVRLLTLSGSLMDRVLASQQSIAGGGLGAVKFERFVNGVRPWSPDTPENRYLLQVSIEASGGQEKQSMEIGFRRFEFKGTSAYLNGERLFLRGMNRHEDDRKYGPVQRREVMDRDVTLLRELHVNFLRPGHYPNDPAWLLACNREGVLIVHENPVYQLGHSLQSVCATLRKRLGKEAARQLIEMIERDRNHPSVVMWSVGNENVPFVPTIRRILSGLCALARRFDPDRPVTLATMHIPYGVIPRLDFCAALGDVLFINEYCGWYSNRAEDVGSYLDAIHRKWPDKPLVVSEFGAGSVKGRMSGDLVEVGMGARRDFTEEYQGRFYQVQLQQIMERPFVAGTMPWVFADFRDDKRPNNPIPNMNLKGLVTYDREPKKAYYVLQEAYLRIKEGRE